MNLSSSSRYQYMCWACGHQTFILQTKRQFLSTLVLLHCCSSSGQVNSVFVSNVVFFSIFSNFPRRSFLGAHTAFHSAHTKQALKGNVGCNHASHVSFLDLPLFSCMIQRLSFCYFFPFLVLSNCTVYYSFVDGTEIKDFN